MIRFLFGFLCLAGVFFAENAHGHNWYPKECCNDEDCKEIPEEIAKQIIRETRTGYTVTLPPGLHPKYPEGATLFYSEDKIRRSPDKHFHVCADEEFTYCLFEPIKNFGT